MSPSAARHFLGTELVEDIDRDRIANLDFDSCASARALPKIKPIWLVLARFWILGEWVAHGLFASAREQLLRSKPIAKNRRFAVSKLVGSLANSKYPMLSAMMGLVTHPFQWHGGRTMSLNELKAADKAVSEILSCAQQLVEGAKRAAQQGDSLDSLERNTWNIVRQIGSAAMELFIRLQAKGDLGSTVETPEGQTLQRSAEPAACEIRSIFGRHTFQRYTYNRGANKAIELRPIDARMSLPAAR
ncbi:MAG: hypothetical protein ACREJM_12275 [Candidatus Saccharimonadales bacterium]